MTRILLALFLLVRVPAGMQTQSGIVTGVLRTSTGLPVEGVRVAVAPANSSIADSVFESLGLTDKTGRYRLENVSPGRYNIVIGRTRQWTYHPGVAELTRATTIQVVAGSTIEVPDMVVSGGNVTGRVVDMATGKGRRIENLVLCCDYSRPLLIANANTVVEGSTFTSTISDDGSFVFPFVPLGNYSLSTVDPNVIPVSWALAIGETGATGLQLDVTEGVEVQGTVLDQTGKPVSASVQLRPKQASSVFATIGPPTNTRAVTELLIPKPNPSLNDVQDRIFKAAKVQSGKLGPDGHFAFQKVYPGAYVFEVSWGGALLNREMQVGITGLTNVSLQVPAILVTGRVIAASGGPLPKLNYIRLVRTGSGADVFYGFPNAEGHFSLLLVPGEYRVFTERLGPSVQSVSAGSRDITNTEFTFEDIPNQQIVVTLNP